jgi:hypothetical protein
MTASGRTVNFDFPYPLPTDPVNVAGDIESLASNIDQFFIDNIALKSSSNTLYVSKDGNDNNNGQTLETAFLTIRTAMANASPGTTVFLKSGDYTENNPITIPPRVALVGDGLRAVSVRPANKTQDIFYLNNACYITGLTFRDHEAPAAAVAYNPDGSAGNIFTSPYVQNCSSITTTGKGMYIDGSKVGGLRSMVLDAYTQFNQGGIGIHIDNQGYAQLVSIFSICCEVGVLCTNGGFCSVTNSNSSFGTYGLKADGVSPVKYTGVTNRTDQTGREIIMSQLNRRPVVNDGVSFDGGQTFFTVEFATEPDENNQSVVRLLENVITPIPINTTCNFYSRSLITASSHTFEYVGTGNNLLEAVPELGGIPIQENEVIETNGGKVFYTSTDQIGDFRIGGELLINRSDGTISGRTFDKSLFAVLTPYILAIEG